METRSGMLLSILDVSMLQASAAPPPAVTGHLARCSSRLS